MIGTGTRRALLTAVGCLLLASCGTATSSTAPAGANPAATLPVATSAATTAATAKAVGSGMTACALITEQDASTALGRAAGQGTGGGTAAASECIYDQGSLIVSMRLVSKAFYDTAHAQAKAKGASDVPGVGDSAFKAGTDQSCTLLFVKGTTLVSILFGGAGAQDAAVAVAKVAASKL